MSARSASKVAVNRIYASHTAFHIAMQPCPVFTSINEHSAVLSGRAIPNRLHCHPRMRSIKFISLFGFLLGCHAAFRRPPPRKGWGESRCVRNRSVLRQNINLPDCHAALKLIPSLTADLHGQLSGGKPPLTFEPPIRHPSGHYLIPAVFQSGHCAIGVLPLQKYNRYADTGTPFPPRPPHYAASALYYQVWPNVKIQAEKLLIACPIGGGHIHTKSLLEGSWFPYKVSVLSEVHAQDFGIFLEALQPYHLYTGGRKPGQELGRTRVRSNWMRV